MTGGKKFYSTEAAGKAFRVTRKTVENWVRKGYINPYRSGTGPVRVSEEEIERGFVELGPTKMRDGRKTLYNNPVLELPEDAEVIE